MPQCTFFCRACKKEFSIILTLSEYEDRSESLITILRNPHEAVKKPNWLVFRAFFGD